MSQGTLTLSSDFGSTMQPETMGFQMNSQIVLLKNHRRDMVKLSLQLRNSATVMSIQLRPSSRQALMIQILQVRVPAVTSRSLKKTKSQRKIYLDFLQVQPNRYKVLYSRYQELHSSSQGFSMERDLQRLVMMKIIMKSMNPQKMWKKKL